MDSVVEKILSRGIRSLTDAEVLSAVVGDVPSGARSIDVAEGLLSCYQNDLGRLCREELPRLRMVEGVGVKCASRIVAAVELGRRVAECNGERATAVTTSDDVVKLFRPSLEVLRHEECWALYLTSTNRVIERMKVSQGGVQTTVVDTRIVVKRAIELLASQLVVVHNHPSGTAQPSPADRVLTDKLCQAAELFDIKVLDHIIIASNEDFSFRKAGFLK